MVTILNRLGVKRNSFHQTMVDFAFNSNDRSTDLFSRSCVEQYLASSTRQYGYRFAQVFEPMVLQEIAILDNVDYHHLEFLDIGESPALTQLKQRLLSVEDISPVESVNLAAALISISRFRLAISVLSRVNLDKCNPRDLFEIAMLQFVVNNRISHSAGVNDAFLNMQAAIKTGAIPPDRIMDAATQAVVWYLKAKAIPISMYHSFLHVGMQLSASPNLLDQRTISSWYRAIAMIPADYGHQQITRKCMMSAHQSALKCLEHTEQIAYDLHFLKTYYESTLKEYMYVVHNKKKAISVAKKLIDLDSVWSPSYGEAGDMYVRYKDYENAAAHYEQAGYLGAPYVGHHLFSAAQAWSLAGNNRHALKLCLKLLALDPENTSLIVHGLKLSRLLNHESLYIFADKYAHLKDVLSNNHIRHLEL